MVHELSCGSVYVVAYGMGDLFCSDPLVQGSTCIPCPGRKILDHWTTGEVPENCFLIATV